MTRAILRGYDLAEPDQTHAVRMLGSVFHGYVSLEMAGGFEPQRPRLAAVLGLDPGPPRRPAARPGHPLTNRRAGARITPHRTQVPSTG